MRKGTFRISLGATTHAALSVFFGTDPCSNHQLNTCCILQASSISTQIYGDVTLLANANGPVTLTMATQSSCTGPPVSDDTSVYANLNPVELDVDVGQPFGLQVQSQTPLAATPENLQKGQSFAMEVRVNSVSKALVAYQVWHAFLSLRGPSAAYSRISSRFTSVAHAFCCYCPSGLLLGKFGLHLVLPIRPAV